MDIKRIYEVITIIKKAKYKAYLVGGSSRDFLYARNFTDVDIATNAPLDYISKTFNVINDQGKSMGSLKINYKNVVMELTRFRKEEYNEKSSFPKVVEYLKDAEDDAIRRDFTINSIYLDVTTNEIVDPYDGIKDLFSYKVKFIGNPKERIKEDPTRIIRGIRLAYKMNFSIDEETNSAFMDCINELDRISSSKLNKEIEKTRVDLGQERADKILAIYNIKERK
jgi:tRNA nucleotidyltransferase (CCA-adding enzyme)